MNTLTNLLVSLTFNISTNTQVLFVETSESEKQFQETYKYATMVPAIYHYRSYHMRTTVSSNVIAQLNLNGIDRSFVVESVTLSTTNFIENR